MRIRALLLLAFFAGGCACSPTPADGDGGMTGPDAGASDAATDAGEIDAGEVDAGAIDAGPGDAGLDAGQPMDAGLLLPDGGCSVGMVGPIGPTFDLTLIRDLSTAQCTYTNQRTELAGLVLVTLRDVSYVSYEFVCGALTPILIKGVLAQPATLTTPAPAVVLAHGLGGRTDVPMASELAASLNMTVLAFTGPGGGKGTPYESQGIEAMAMNGRRLFDTIPDVRGSWFAGHAMAAMRGLTCLAARTDVDPTRLGMTGFSGGAVATLLSSGVDDRIVAAVPAAGSGAWDVIVQSPNAWEHELLTLAGYTPQSPEWVRWTQAIAPARLIGSTSTKVMMVEGATDEFFPLTGFVPTFRAIPGAEARMSVIANYDHGACYTLTGGESSSTLEARRDVPVKGGQRMWFKHWFGTDTSFSYVPSLPTAVVTVDMATGHQVAGAVVDPGGSNLSVDSVKFWVSGDDAFTFIPADLQSVGSNLWGRDLFPVTIPADAVYFVEVIYRTNELIPDRFALTSVPFLPAGHVPRIRGSLSSATPCQ